MHLAAWCFIRFFCRVTFNLEVFAFLFFQTTFSFATNQVSSCKHQLSAFGSFCCNEGSLGSEDPSWSLRVHWEWQKVGTRGWGTRRKERITFCLICFINLGKSLQENECAVLVAAVHNEPKGLEYPNFIEYLVTFLLRLASNESRLLSPSYLLSLYI